MKKTFSVDIAAKKYYLAIDHSDEEVMRRAAKRLNTLISELQKNKFDCEQRDIIAMAALLISIENEENILIHKYSSEQQELQELASSVKRALDDLGTTK